MIMAIPVKKEAFRPRGSSERTSLQRPIIQADILASGGSRLSAERTAKIRKKLGLIPRNPIWLKIVDSRMEINNAQAIKIVHSICVSFCVWEITSSVP